jgi:sec-independent protein translocase protein TatC
MRKGARDSAEFRNLHGLEHSGDTNQAMEAEREEPPQEEGKSEKEMSFLDHLEELRWRVIYTFAGIIIGAVLVWIFIDVLMEEVLLRPARLYDMNLQNLRPFGQVFLYMQVAIFGGIVISIPNIVYQIWKFVSPGLYPHERRYATRIITFTSLCFLAGVAFAYFAIMPAALKFFVGFGSPHIENIIAIDYYFEFIMMLMLGSGLIFELPMLSFFLSRLGIVTPQLMRKYWRHAMVLSAIVAAFLSPGPDPVSMLLMAIPLVFLYEVSIWIARISQKKRLARVD